jgi:hypothetical protein
MKDQPIKAYSATVEDEQKFVLVLIMDLIA